jgi:hypothetical protein
LRRIVSFKSDNARLLAGHWERCDPVVRISS